METNASTVLKDFKHTCTVENAEKFADWIQNRGGIAVWGCLDLARAGTSWSTPVKDSNGCPFPKPHWSATNKPTAIHTSTAEIGVETLKEVKRFRVGLRMGTNGFALKLTDAASNRLHKALDKAGEGSTYRFDYDTQEAVIMVPDSVQSLVEWIKNNKN